MSAASPIPLPARISKYELLEFLGGGMSLVFRARDTVLGRTVAIKILTPAGVADPDTKARFLHEARTASCISHENILAVYDFGEEAGKPYMVMEFLRGRTLRAALQENRLADLPGKLRVALQVARALAFVHQNQVVHRDVKPENINLDDTCRAKLMDFGIAKAADLSLTQPGYVLGTPYYMAPEQIMGKPVTSSVDIYAFGIMLYEMLLNTRPYGGDSIETIFYKIMHEPLDLAPLTTAGIRPEVVAIVARCTRQEPGERYPDFNGVVADLENALGAPPTATAAHSRTPLFVAIGVAVVALAAAGYFWVAHHHRGAGFSRPTRIPTTTGFMHLVPEGNFLFGPGKTADNLGPFYIDETEVSNRYYADFCTETHHPPPPGFNADAPQLPVINVTIDEARAFAAWAGKRLPTAKEWEKAARGSNGLTYPWGNEKDPRRANVKDNPTLKESKLHPVHDFPESASPYQVLNLIGNVWEFVDGRVPSNAEAVQAFGRLSPPATAAEPWVTARGGSYALPLVPALTWDVFTVPERYHSEVIGFRCAQNVK